MNWYLRLTEMLLPNSCRQHKRMTQARQQQKLNRAKQQQTSRQTKSYPGERRPVQPLTGGKILAAMNQRSCWPVHHARKILIIERCSNNIINLFTTMLRSHPVVMIVRRYAAARITLWSMTSAKYILSHLQSILNCLRWKKVSVSFMVNQVCPFVCWTFVYKLILARLCLSGNWYEHAHRHGPGMAWSSCGSTAICYVLPVLCMMSWFPIMGPVVVWCQCSSFAAVLCMGHHPFCVVLVVSWSRQWRVPRLDESTCEGCQMQSMRCAIALFFVVTIISHITFYQYNRA